MGTFFSTEDMSFEFKKAFAKATELRSLTFSQQWTMTDESIFTTETPVSMALFNVPPGITQALLYKRTTLFADFLSTNSLIHIWKIGRIVTLSSRKTDFVSADFAFAVLNDRITSNNEWKRNWKSNFFLGKKFSVRQLQGTYGPFLVKTAHYDIYQENCWNSSKIWLSLMSHTYLHLILRLVLLLLLVFTVIVL